MTIVIGDRTVKGKIMRREEARATYDAARARGQIAALLNHSGATINAVTKSGTNAYHGDAFEFVRNGIFNARNAFASSRDTLKRNQYGGTLALPSRQM